MKVKKCIICDYHEGRDDLMSALGATPICLECFEAKAEHPVDIHRACKRYNTGPYLRDLLHDVTCWAGHDLGYLDLRAYERRVSAQMPAVVKEQPKLSDEDESILKEVVNKVVSIRSDDDFNFYVWDELTESNSVYGIVQEIVNFIANKLGFVRVTHS